MIKWIGKEILFFRGNRQLAAGNFEKARVSLEKALSLWSRDWGLCLRLALANEALGNVDTAEELWKRATILAPGNPVVQSYAAIHFLEREKPTEAAALVEGALAKHPDNGLVKCCNGWLLTQTGKNDEGLAVLEKNVDSAGYHFQASFLHFIESKMMVEKGIDKVLESILQPIEIKEDRRSGLYQAIRHVLANLWGVLERTAKWLSRLWIFRRKRPSTQNNLERAEEMFRQGRSEDAEKELEAILELQPSNNDAFFLLAQSYFENKKFEQAISLIDEQKDMAGPFLLRIHGLSNLHMNKVDEALESLETAADGSIDFLDHYLIAVTHIAGSQNLKARARLSRALSYMPHEWCTRRLRDYREPADTEGPSDGVPLPLPQR
jgi:Tfp pilus assembly protein PilF